MKPAVVFKWTLRALIAIVVITIVYVGIVLSSGLPTLDELENPRQDLATRVYSADGELLEHFAATRRTYLPYDSIPEPFINALIATEDREFRSHWGVHSWRIVKAVVKNVFALRAKEGASTITQQLAQNLYFKKEKRLERKIREAYTAFQIERTYTKNEILEMYANTVYYGRGAYGIREAAYTYFGVEPSGLSVPQCAFLVALFKAPERYSKTDSLGIMRRNLVLSLMADAEYLTEAQAKQFSEEPLGRVDSQTLTRGIAPHFVEMIRQKLGPRGEWNHLLDGRDLYRDGLVIHTTLNANVQRYANAAVKEHLELNQKLFDRSWSWQKNQSTLNSVLRRAAKQTAEYVAAPSNKREQVIKSLLKNRRFVDSVKKVVTTIQMGVVVLDARNGGIIGMVGASPRAMELDPAGRYSLNHVTQIKRQPGSAFKPFVYTAAVEHGLTSDSLIESGPFSTVLSSGAVWAPRGSSKTGGPVTLAHGLKYSTNTVAARLITNKVTPYDVVDVCRRMGIESSLQAVPSIALGAVEVSPLELTAAYIPFVNQGMAIPPAYITKIEDKLGNVIYQAKLPTDVRDAISVETSREMVRMMRGVVDGGTGSRVRKYYRGEAAGKTGTTNEFADAWFVGYNPRIVAGVWTGFDDRRIKFTGDYGQGGRAAAPVWGKLLQKIHANRKLGLTQQTFAVVADSLNFVTEEMISNPPSELFEDEVDVYGPPAPPAQTPKDPNED